VGMRDHIEELQKACHWTARAGLSCKRKEAVSAIAKQENDGQRSAAVVPDRDFDEQSARDLYTSISKSFDKYSTSGLSILAPKQAQNGAVIPFKLEFASPIVGTLFVFVSSNEDPFVAAVQYTKKQSAYYFSGRLSMARTGDIVAVFRDSDGKIFANKAHTKVVVGARVHSTGERPSLLKAKQRSSGGRTEVIALVKAGTSLQNFVRRVDVATGGTPLVTMHFSPRMSTNPLFGVAYDGGPDIANVLVTSSHGETLSTATE